MRPRRRFRLPLALARAGVGSAARACAAGGLAIALAFGLVVALALAAPVHAQVRPDLPWRTLDGGRLRVHYTPGLEDLARRTLVNAESAYVRLARELPPPRGLIDLVVADNVDFANGLATPFPTNRIVVYARPPVDELPLRNHEDWNLTLVTHEMAHVFHLDRAQGMWRLAQRVFGRAAPLFPNAYAPNWLLEGVAVHYETRLTRGGRLGGAEFPAAVRALALGDALPPLDGVASPRPFHPGGNAPYLFGAFLVQRLATHDPALGEDVAMARLIDRMSGRINPWRHNASAREAVGASFGTLYATWRDSLRLLESRVELPAVRTRTTHGWTAAFPRFLPDGELSYVADDARRMPGLYTLHADGRRTRGARRNNVDANAPLGPRRTVHAEWDRTDPYSIRSDLYVGTGNFRRRLTVEGRLAHPDVHPRHAGIVAVRTRAGATDLVLLRTDAHSPRTLAEGSLDRAWSEPRWSRAGGLIAAALWERGGRTSIVVLDTLGREQRRLAPRATDRAERLAVVSAPAWLPGDTLLLFVSDHEGRPMVYRGDIRSGAYDRLWETRTALRTPDASADGSQLAAVELRAEGWVVVTRAMPAMPPLPAAPPAHDAAPLPEFPAAVANADLASTRYAPAATLGPTWWLPSVATTDENGLLVGAMSSGRDVIGRHAWTATVQHDLARPELSGRAGYAYAGVGNPVLSVGVEQDWGHASVFDQNDALRGTLAVRASLASASMLLTRPRARVTTFLILGGEAERVAYRTYPKPLLQQFSNPSVFDARTLPRAVASVGLSTMQRPGLSVSVEDGIALQATGRRRFAEGVGRTAVNEAILQGSAAKSLPLPGFARHVVAARGAFGTADASTRTPFAVGGVSGSSLEVLPGFSYGDTQRTFFVRGFDPGAQRGNRAAAASAEYRLPLVRVGRGFSMLPVFLQKISVLGFADAGAAWCSDGVVGTPTCTPPIEDRAWMTSLGGELVLDAALQYDVLYRFRIGLAYPMDGLQFATRGTTFYFTLGNTF